MNQQIDEAVLTAALAQQVAFVLEIDRLKNVYRQTPIIDKSRRENSAEHSWHIAVMAIVLASHADTPVNTCQVIKMLLIHDIVEIDAGDTFAYDEGRKVDQAKREQRAAARIFGLLPAEQAGELLDLWREFEARTTPEARFAHSVDRLMPLLHNYFTGGGSWTAHNVAKPAVVKRMACIDDSSQRLAAYVRGLIDDAVERGYLAGGDGIS